MLCGMTFDEIQQVPVAAGTVYYRKVGNGPDVLFIHGWPLHGETYRALVEQWSGRFTCHVVDLPGAGQSTWNETTPISLSGHAAAVCPGYFAAGP